MIPNLPDYVTVVFVLTALLTVGIFIYGIIRAELISKVVRQWIEVRNSQKRGEVYDDNKS